MPVEDLRPSQNEIGFDESIKNLLTDKYGTLDTFLKGQANVGPDPIVTYGGDFVIDGHHRWSQVFVANPGATIPSLDIASKSGYSPVDVLKAVHAAIAADLGSVPQSTASGMNVLSGVSRGDVEGAVQNYLDPEAMDVWRAYTRIETAGDLVEHLHRNLTRLAKKGAAQGAPDRSDMPQTDTGGDTEDRLDLLEEGLVNIAPPYDKASRRRASVGKTLSRTVENWIEQQVIGPLAESLDDQRIGHERPSVYGVPMEFGETWYEFGVEPIKESGGPRVRPRAYVEQDGRVAASEVMEGALPHEIRGWLMKRIYRVRNGHF